MMRFQWVLLTGMAVILGLSPVALAQHFDDMEPGTNIQDDTCYNPPGGSPDGTGGIPGTSYAGRWKTSYGIMNFYETPTGQVTGQQEDSSGSFSGSRQGDFVQGRFSDSFIGGTGNLIFVLRRNGTCFNGGYNTDDGESRGQWNGHRVPAR